jgi:hypothetical protein
MRSYVSAVLRLPPSARIDVLSPLPDVQDSTFVYASYAATFLLKLVSPTFASFIDEEAAMRLVRETAEVLETAAVDEQHTPALCASYLFIFFPAILSLC